MKTLTKLTKRERLKIVLDIVYKLKRIPANNEAGYIDIYKEEYPAMKRLKEIFNKYIKQDEEYGVELSGKVYFPELSRVIYYTLPINNRREPFFKMEWKNN